MSNDCDGTNDSVGCFSQPNSVCIRLEFFDEFCKAIGNVGFECLVVAILLCIQGPVQINEIAYIAWLYFVPHFPSSFRVNASCIYQRPLRSLLRRALSIVLTSSMLIELKFRKSNKG